MQPTRTIRSLCAAALVASISYLHADPILEPEAEFLIRSGMAEFDSVESLYENPRKLQYEVDSWRVDGWKVIRSETDFHAIFPVPIEYVIFELTNYENTKEIYPRVVESKLEYASPNRYDRHALWVHLRIKVLNFGAEYVYVTNNWLEESGNGYIQKYNLNRSPDGTLYQMLGNWYIEEILVDGEPHTYVRQYAILGIQKGTTTMEVAMRAFGAWQLRQIFKNIYRAIREKIDSEQT